MNNIAIFDVFLKAPIFYLIILMNFFLILLVEVKNVPIGP